MLSQPSEDSDAFFLGLAFLCRAKPETEQWKSEDMVACFQPGILMIGSVRQSSLVTQDYLYCVTAANCAQTSPILIRDVHRVIPI